MTVLTQNSSSKERGGGVLEKTSEIIRKLLIRR
jgi:hypothetical protein